MILRILVVYVIVVALTFFFLHSKNVELRESIAIAQSSPSETLGEEPTTQTTSPPKSIAGPEEAPPSPETTNLTEPMVIPTTVSEMAESLAEFYELVNRLEKLGANPDMNDPEIQRFIRSMPTMIGAFDVHEQSLKNPEGFGSFMAQFIGQILDVDSDKTSLFKALYTKHRSDAISQGLVADGPPHEAVEDRNAWLRERHAFRQAFRVTVKTQIGVDLEAIPYGWSVTSQISEMQQVLQL